MSTTSPACASAFASTAFISSSVRNFANEELKVPSSFILTHARPFAPTPFAASVSLSISFLVRVLTAFLAVMHLTLPPASIAPVNTPKPHFATTSLRSVISIA